METNEADLVSWHCRPARLRAAPTPGEGIVTDAADANTSAAAAARRAAVTKPLLGFAEVLSCSFHTVSNQAVLTVKLSGRAEAPDWSRGRILSSCARGDTIELHGPLQRLLERLRWRQTKLTSSLGTAVPRDCAQLRRQAKGSYPKLPTSTLAPPQRRAAPR